MSTTTTEETKEQARHEAARQRIAHEVRHLMNTDRGRNAAAKLLSMLEGPLCSLDNGNQRAVLQLIVNYFGSYPGSVLEALSDRKRL